MVPEIIKQPAGSLICAVPDVVVPSVYVPSELAVHVPVTLSEPEIVTCAGAGIESRQARYVHVAVSQRQT